MSLSLTALSTPMMKVSRLVKIVSLSVCGGYFDFWVVVDDHDFEIGWVIGIWSCDVDECVIVVLVVDNVFDDE